jgi:hypothetical protein
MDFSQIVGLAANPSGNYISWGVISISVTNLMIILAMILLFVLALFLPFPGGHDDGGDGQ